MKQYFLLGASSVYGVGGEHGGWGELLKQHLHTKMYGEDGIGERLEVFNFAKSGATVQFVLDTYPDQIKHYGRGGEIVTIVGVGGNNSKAVDAPDNYVSTVQEYVEQMQQLLELLKRTSTQVVVVGNGFVDESKTNPKVSPFSGKKTYFTNARRVEFQEALKKLCVQMDITFITANVSQEEWQQKYLYEDGLHPNDAGHALFFEAIRSALDL